MLGRKWLVNLQVTIAACVLIERRDKSIFMAVFTCIVLVCLQCKPGRVVVKGNLFPIGGIVTGGALRAIGTIMRVIRGVTGSAVLRRAFEDAIDMAIFTGHSCMLAIEMEGKLRVIHFGRLPTFGRVTTSALVAKLTFMCVILGMTGGAVLRCAFEDTVDMAALASHCRMFPIQMESKFGMIHLCILPAFGSVTGRAVGSKLTVVMVIFLMA